MAHASQTPPAESIFAHGHVTRVRAGTRWRPSDLRELWAYRELLWVLARRDVQVRYRQTLLGAGWAIVRPVMTMLVFSVVFGRFAGIPSSGLPYPVFVFAGLLPWTFFSGAVGAAGASLVGSAGLVGKVYFPRLVLPLASIGVGLVDLLLAAVVLLGLMGFYGLAFTAQLLAVPLLLLLLATTAAAFGILVAALSVTYRDVQQLVPYALQVWMFLSPVIYPVELFPERWRWLLVLNPLTGLIGGFRAAFLGQPLDVAAIAVSSAASLPLLVVAVVVFQRSERRFADLL
jgi:lipopolysaccharide transport system permease protein